MRINHPVRLFLLILSLIPLSSCKILGTDYHGGGSQTGVTTNGAGGSTGSVSGTSGGGSSTQGMGSNPATYISVTGPLGGTAGECLAAPFIITGRDTSGAPSAAFPSGTKFIVTETSGGDVFLDAGCGNRAVGGAFDAPTNTNTVNFWVKGTRAGNFTVRVTSNNYAKVDLDVVYNPGITTHVKIDVVSSAGVFVCTSFTVRQLDGLNELARTNGDLALHFSVTGGPRAGVYDQPGCSGGGATDFVMPNGVNQKTYYIFGNDTGAATLAVTAPNPVAGDSEPISFLPATAPQIVVSGPAGNTPAGECAAFTLSNQLGGPAYPVRVPTTFTIATSEDARTIDPIVVYSGANCTGTPTRAITLNTGESSGQFSIRDKHAETLSVTGATPGFAMGTGSATFVAAAPYSISLSGVPQQLRAGQCSGLVRATLYDKFGNIATAAARTILALAGTRNGAVARVVFSLAADCSGDAVTSTAVENGAKFGTFSFISTDPGALTLTASSDPLKPGSANTSVAIASGTPKKLVLVGPADQVLAGDCATFTLLSQDGNGNPLEISPTDLVLSGSTTSALGLVYARPNCSGDSTVTIAAGQTQVSFGLRDTKEEDITLTVRDPQNPANASASLLVHIIANVPAVLGFINPPTAVSAGACYTTTLGLFDIHGNPAKAKSAFDAQLTTTKPVNFSRGTQCSGSSNTSPFAVGAKTATYAVSFRPELTTTGHTTLLAVGPPGIAATSLDLEIGPPETLHWKLTADAGSVAAGGCLHVSLSSLGQSEQLLVYNAVIASLTSTASVADVFYSQAGCPVDAKLSPAQVTVSTGNNPAEFWVKSTHAETFSISANASGFSTSLQITVTPAAATELFLLATGPGTLQKNTFAGTYTVQLRDTYGNIVTPTSAVPFALSNVSSAGLSISVDNAGNNLATAIGANQNSGNFFLTSTSSGAKTFSLTGGGFTSNSRTVTVLDPAPTLESVSPAFGPIAGGTEITIKGVGLVVGGTITVGGNPCTSPVAVAIGVKCTTSAGAAGPADVIFSNPNSLPATLVGAFTYLLAAPTVGQAQPNTGPTTGGIPVTIPGSGFGSGTTVTIGGAPCPVTAYTSTSITCTLPPGTGTVTIVVSNPNSFTGSTGFTYMPPGPTVAGISPVSGPATGNYTLQVSGAGFSTAVPGATVQIGGVNCPIVTITATLITCTVPPHSAGAVNVTVTNPGTAASPNPPLQFTYLNAPATLTFIEPTSGTKDGGTSVTLHGTFAPGAKVKFGDIEVTSTPSAADIIAITPPHGAGKVDVTVTNPGAIGVTLPLAYNYLNPSATNLTFTPNHGPAAGGITVTFAAAGIAVGATITIGGTNCPVIAGSQTATSIACTLPAHAPGSFAVVLTNPLSDPTMAAATFLFDAPPPSISGINPTTGPTTGGTIFTITGANLGGTTSITIGGTVCPLYGTPSATAVSCTIAAHAAGTFSIVLTVTGASPITLTQTFTYVAPAPTWGYVSPNVGPTSGGTLIHIYGNGFIPSPAGQTPTTTVLVGGLACAIVGAITSTNLNCITSAHAAGVVAIEIRNTAALTLLVNNAFLYQNPIPCITGISPAPPQGPLSGGNAITITGGPFATGAVLPVVLVGNNACLVQPATATATSLTCIVPPGIAGLTSISVQNPFSPAPVIVANAYRYLLAPPTISYVTPPNGPLAGQNIVTVVGAGFVAGATVTFGTLAGVVQSITATAITVKVPPGAAPIAVNVSVQNPYAELATRIAGYAYLSVAPTMTTFSPSSGPLAGGNVLTIGGTNFPPNPQILVGNRPCPVVGTPTATSASCTVPAGAAPGPTNVVMGSATSYSSGSNATAYTYLAPAILANYFNGTPRSGTTAGGTIFSLSNSSGTAFVSGATISLGGLACPILSLTATSITCATAAHVAGTVDVVITNLYTYATTLVGYYTYVTPPRQACAIFVQHSISCGDANNYEWSMAWIPIPAGLPVQNGIYNTQVTPFVNSRVAAALFRDNCHRAPAALYGAATTYTPSYPTTLNVSGYNYALMTGNSVGSPDCQAFFSTYYSPLILDMKNQGITLTSPSTGVKFDIEGTGPRPISWPTNPDNSMFLVLDRNHDGNIDSINEMFGNNTMGPDNQKAANGFEALAKYDDNHDGFIDSKDSIYFQLRLWSDKNRNGRVEAGELLTLDSQGVKRIDLHYLNVRERNDFYGNETLQRSVVDMSNGGMVRIFDLWFVPGRGN